MTWCGLVTLSCWAICWQGSKCRRAQPTGSCRIPHRQCRTEHRRVGRYSTNSRLFYFDSCVRDVSHRNYNAIQSFKPEELCNGSILKMSSPSSRSSEFTTSVSSASDSCSAWSLPLRRAYRTNIHYSIICMKGLDGRPLQRKPLQPSPVLSLLPHAPNLPADDSKISPSYWLDKP